MEQSKIIDTLETYQCLHWIDELELLCIALVCDCYMMNIIQHKYPSLIQCYGFLMLIFAKLLLLLLLQSSQTSIVTVFVTIATIATTIKTIILLCY